MFSNNKSLAKCNLIPRAFPSLFHSFLLQTDETRFQIFWFFVFNLVWKKKRKEVERRRNIFRNWISLSIYARETLQKKSNCEITENEKKKVTTDYFRRITGKYFATSALVATTWPAHSLIILPVNLLKRGLGRSFIERLTQITKRIIFYLKKMSYFRLKSITTIDTCPQPRSQGILPFW